MNATTETNGQSSNGVDPAALLLGYWANGEAAYLEPAKLPGCHISVEANSGGGKSYAIRRLAETALAGFLPIILIDSDGEFPSLTHAFHHLLVCGIGDCDRPLHAGMAEELVRLALEARWSMVLKVGTLATDERERFIAALCEALLPDTPASKPVLVIIDEAQRFVPQRGSTACKDAILDLLTRGRKFGVSVVLATQRSASVDKTAWAQAGARLTGKLGSEADRGRAAEDAGLTRAEKKLLNGLSTGQFVVTGPIFDGTPQRITIAPTVTRHGTALPAVAFAPPAISKEEAIALLSGASMVRPNSSEAVPTPAMTLPDQVPAVETPRLDGHIETCLAAAGASGLTLDALLVLTGASFRKTDTRRAVQGLVQTNRVVVKRKRLRLNGAPPRGAVKPLASHVCERLAGFSSTSRRVAALLAGEGIRLERGEIAARLEVPARSVNLSRALDELILAGLVRRSGERYVATSAGLELLAA